MHQVRERRRTPRYKTSTEAKCLRSNKKDMVSHDVRLVDISQGGAQIVSRLGLPVGEVVALKVEGQSGPPLVFRVVRTVRQGDFRAMGMELIHGAWSPEFLQKHGHPLPAEEDFEEGDMLSIWDEEIEHDNAEPDTSDEPNPQDTMARSFPNAQTAILALPSKAPGIDLETERKIRGRLSNATKIDPKVSYHDGLSMWQVIDRKNGTVLCEFIRREDAVFHARARQYVEMLVQEIDRLRR